MTRKKKTKRTKVSVSPNIERRQKLVLNLLTSTPWPWFHTDTCTCLPKNLNRFIITHMGKHKAQSNFNDEVDIVAKPEGSQCELHMRQKCGTWSLEKWRHLHPRCQMLWKISRQRINSFSSFYVFHLLLTCKLFFHSSSVNTQREKYTQYQPANQPTQ